MESLRVGGSLWQHEKRVTARMKSIYQHSVSMTIHLNEPQKLPPSPTLRNDNDDIVKLNNTLISKTFKHFS